MVYHKVGKLLHAWLPLMVLVHIGKFLKNIFWFKKSVSAKYDKIPLIYINLKEQELLTLRKHMNLSPGFSGVPVNRSLVFCIIFCLFAVFM